MISELAVSYAYAGSRLSGSPNRTRTSVSGFLTAWPCATPAPPTSISTRASTSSATVCRVQFMLSSPPPLQQSNHRTLAVPCHLLAVRLADLPGRLSRRRHDRRLAALVLERQDRAGDVVPVPPVIDERRVVHAARLLRVEAARMEPASLGRVDRGRHVPGQDDAFAAHPRVGDGDRGEQGLRVRD